MPSYYNWEGRFCDPHLVEHFMEFAYPLRCQPHFQNYLWGGRKLATRLGKPLPDEGLWAESWEIIDHPHHQSLVTNGPLAGLTLHDIIQRSPDWLIGPRLYSLGFRSLPLLLKYLDCQQVLSVQVHPDNHYGSRLVPPDLGKTEAWYILDAEPGSVLYAGLKAGVTADLLRKAIDSGSLENYLHAIEPQAGDCIFIPAGTVHALGAGLLVAEIQQASNTTFRLYDWQRVGPDGTPRPLHIERALEVADFQSGPRPLQRPLPTAQNGRQRLVSCDKFCLDRLADEPTETEKTPKSAELQTFTLPVGGDGTFHIVTAPHGGVEIVGDRFREVLAHGDSLLLPAAMTLCSAVIHMGAVLLDMYVPESA